MLYRLARLTDDAWRVRDGGDPAGTTPPAEPAAPPPASVTVQPPPAVITATVPSTSTAPAPTSPASPAAPTAPPSPGSSSPPSFDEWVRDPVNAGFVKQLRDEAAGHRTKARDAEGRAEGILKAVMEAAGLQQDGKPDPARVAEQLQQQLQARDTELRALRVDSALSSVFGKHSADPRLTRAVLMADGTLGNLDPTSADFAVALEAAVVKALADIPALKVASPAPAAPPAPAPPAPPASPVSGGQFNGPGASNGVTQYGREQLKTMSPEEINDARAKGHLDALLGRI